MLSILIKTNYSSELSIWIHLHRLFFSFCILFLFRFIFKTNFFVIAYNLINVYLFILCICFDFSNLKLYCDYINIFMYIYIFLYKYQINIFLLIFKRT